MLSRSISCARIGRGGEADRPECPHTTLNLTPISGGGKQGPLGPIRTSEETIRSVRLSRHLETALHRTFNSTSATNRAWVVAEDGPRVRG